MKLIKLREEYIKNGYAVVDANNKVCQDVILNKIAKSSLSRNITIKGGVVMHHISNDIRRATRDIDFDFIKYSLEDNSIISFIDKLNQIPDSISIRILHPIEKLNHQEYHGKRVYIEITDEFNNKLKTKLDIGVHKNFDIEQVEYCFDLNTIGGSISLLINSKEQIFTEKLRALLKFGFASTRYKDVFDFYFLINNAYLDKTKLINYFNVYIFNDNDFKENNINDICNRLNIILHSKGYLRNLNSKKHNWLEIDSKKVVENILNYFRSLEIIEIPQIKTAVIKAYCFL